MRYRLLCANLAILSSLSVLSCSWFPSAAREEPPSGPKAPPKPALILKVAGLDLFNYRKRIERKDVEALASFLRREQIEVLTVQGISRYAKVKGRIDFVEELAARTEMHHIFGETVNNPSWQEGNAIFSIYPIRSSRNTEYDIKSANFESALQVAVDAGVKDVVIVSTRLPEKATSRELTSCVQMMLSLRNDAENPPFIVMGNLPVASKLRAASGFVDVEISPGRAQGATPGTRVWYVEDATLKALSAQRIDTEFGAITVAEFGLFSGTQLQ